MYKTYFEEKIDTCENATIFGGACLYRGIVRRTVSMDFFIRGKFYCEDCMPDFFINSKDYPVILLHKKVSDLLFTNYLKFYRKYFTSGVK